LERVRVRANFDNASYPSPGMATPGLISSDDFNTSNCASIYVR
jgi:hypothetical protein